MYFNALKIKQAGCQQRAMSHALIAVRKYGSRITTGISKVVYDKLLEDPELAPFFVDVDIDALREHVADFFGVVTGGPDICAAGITMMRIRPITSRMRILTGC